MSGPFGKNAQPATRPKRNTFDLSHQNNLTMEFGKLYPFLCEPVLPGDSVRLDTAFGIRAMPTAFPLQTKIRADVHYFYVRNRNLWKDWPDFIGKMRDDLVLPYTNNQYNPLDESSLVDYLGLPTSPVSVRRPLNVFLGGSPFVSSTVLRISDTYAFRPDNSDNYTWHPPVISYSEIPNIACYPSATSGTNIPVTTPCFQLSGIDDISNIDLFNNSVDRIYLTFRFPVTATQDESLQYTPCLIGSVTCSSDRLTTLGLSPEINPKVTIPYTTRTVPGDAVYFTLELSIDWYNEQRNQNFTQWEEVLSDVAGYHIAFLPTSALSTEVFQRFAESCQVSYVTSEYTRSASDPSVGSDPAFNFNFNALPLRAYESIYNSFYRNEINNPYILDGSPVYNEYIPTKEGGLDTNTYSLRRRNWEQDFITTATTSPQQGIAPLVGITNTGRATFVDPDSGTNYEVQLTTADDGDTITGATYQSNLPNSVARSLVNVATSGISISDFRGVNALQRWLEINLRRGYKYKDQIMSHFGVDISYAELDMPEFLGGATQWFDSSQINQTSEASDESPLGSYAGQLSLVGGSKHPVTKYFDEHGYIIGIVSIAPVPVYTSTASKDWFKTSPLDYYFPEFGHLGYQPVPFREVAPLETIIEDQDPLSETFGYQRAWYEYMARTDEAHGQFRSLLKDFILMRQFQKAPSLTDEFLTISAGQLNQVFTVNSVDGVPVAPFLGQIHIKEVMKRPIPRYLSTSLE